jgi:hypothetical protein
VFQIVSAEYIGEFLSAELLPRNIAFRAAAEQKVCELHLAYFVELVHLL